MKLWFKHIAAVFSLALVAACGGGDDHPSPGTVAAEATSRGFTALVAAADKAGLVPALNASASSLTVFAPTDAAFTSLATSLGFSSASAMVTALDSATLAKILQYHVLPSKKLASQFSSGPQPTLYTFEGAAATLALNTASGVKITDKVLTQATVTTADVPASNGVIHVVDKVLVPPGVLNIVQMAQLNPAFSVLVEAVVAANLAAPLSGAGPFTVFAPTNDAFASALSELTLTKAQLLASPSLASILSYHVVTGNVRAANVVALPKPAAVPTLQGSTFSVGTTLAITDGRARTANLVATDVIGSNGVIHVIDKVLLPAVAP